MSFLSGIKSAASHAAFWRHDESHRTEKRAGAQGQSDSFQAGKAHAPTTWWLGRPLSEGKNAHKTNTKEQFAAALKDGSNWFEGDIRKELHGNKIELRHDPGQETGDNLTLKEWLDKGKASGRGLKLDVKEPEHMAEIVREVKASGVPGERLMFNLGDKAMAEWGPKLRQEFPNATLAINPTGSGEKLTSKEVNRMIDLAKQGGQPATFVVRYDRLTPEAIGKLKAAGTISVWNDVGQGGLGKGDIARETRALKKAGVNGVIDLRPSLSNLEKAENVVDLAKNKAGELLRSAGSFLGL